MRISKLGSTTRHVTARYDDQHKQRLLRRLTRKRSDVEFYLNADFGWRGGVILAWSGMRGAVTVAAAQTLPPETPFRPQLLLIAFTVATATLLVQGLSLPALIRTLRIPGDDDAADRAEYADAASTRWATGPIIARRSGLDPAGRLALCRRVLAPSQRGPSGYAPIGPASCSLSGARADREYRDLMLRASPERDVLLSARSDGTYSSRTLARAQISLDVEEARMQLIRMPEDD